jgi:diguanylate cyclase
MGDRVLQFVGRFFTQCCRQFDVACRIGGDEFALIIPEADPEIASLVVGRIEAGLLTADDAPPLPPGLSIGFSSGVSLFPTQAHTIENLIALADHAMYLRKRDRKLRTLTGT